MTPRASPAVLQAAVETETAEGGRTRVWADVATLWVTLAYGAATADEAQEMRPVRVEVATATARDHPAAEAGQQLAITGDDAAWRVLEMRRGAPAPGRMTLLLDREG